ncbi:MAG: thiamine diphosphokinase [Anaerolineaceae bacterium]|nr:thiamine diphosphokinase [Anaerolineaceae bacterium]NTV36205.1 thiamine diphosphokinase [Anaerolineaceae bacterium]
MTKQRALIFVNGEVQHIEALRNLIQPEDMLIAADGGLRHVLNLGHIPHILIGDLDSIDLNLLPDLQKKGVEVLRFPVEKDETDLELAIQTAVKRGCKPILLVGALGGRLDQTLGNIFLLTNSAWTDLDISMDDGIDQVFLVRTERNIHGQPGDIVSLLPLNGSAIGVCTENLKYPLNNETLYPDRTRGISNKMLRETARVTIQSGLLLCIHTRANG